MGTEADVECDLLLTGASQEPLHWMEKLENMTKGYNVTSLAG